MRKKSVSFYLLLLLLVSFAFNSGCAKNKDADQADNANREKYQQIAGYSITTMIEVATKLTLFSFQSPQSFPMDLIPSYDGNTGWWSLNLQLSNNQIIAARIQLNDASGNFYKYYDPNIITNIKATGEGSGTNVDFSYNLTLTQMGNGYNAILINGSGAVNYQGTSGTFTVNNVAINKYQDGIPDGGQMVVVVQGCSFNMVFNGNNSIQVTYSYQGQSYTMTINLATGQIS
ncbi:MAG: hypothetical protein ACM3SY_02820 [Candidatus Omnitrophota bacterium]